MLSYVVVGYALAFGSGSVILGWTGIGLLGVPFTEYAFAFFQVKLWLSYMETAT